MSATNKSPWLSVIGIGEDGLVGLSSSACTLLSSANLIIGGQRQLSMIPPSNQKRIVWPSPIRQLLEKLESFRGTQTCIVATGDPLCFGIGSTLTRFFPIEEMIIIPSHSAFTLACARHGWPHHEVDLVSLHGRSISSLEIFLRPNGHLVILSNDENTPSNVAKFLSERGYGTSLLTVFEHMNGPKEKRFEGLASNWTHLPAAPFNTITVKLSSFNFTNIKTRVPGLPDNAFKHDGQLTKSEVRATTLSALEPFPGALLWDVGAGSGSVGIEWMRTDHRCQAIAIEDNSERAVNIAGNAIKLGTPNLKIIQQKAPASFSPLPKPDAIFIGGGITSKGMVEQCWLSLKEGGCLVANVVTTEGEALVLKYQKKMGGSLTRVGISRLEKIGSANGWRPSMQVTQWKINKPFLSLKDNIQ